MPRLSKLPARPGLPDNTFIIDNGAYVLKAGFAPEKHVTDEENLLQCQTIPNCLVRTRDRKTYVAAQSDEITQWGEAIFRRPVEHGQLVNWEAQKEIWDQSFFDKATAKHNVYVEDPAATTLILTESPNTMPALQKNTDEIMMEEYGFGGYMRSIGSPLNAYNDLHPLFESEAALKAYPKMRDSPMECLLVVDGGYSHTTITPVFEGRPLQRAVKRFDIGGKHLTNLLKEIISVRYFDLHQETKIVNDIKEDVSFVSRDFKADMEKAWRGNKTQFKSSIEIVGEAMDIDSELYHDTRVDYVLPDGIRLLRGFSRPHDSSASAARKRKLNAVEPESSEISMTLGNERFTIAETMFHPADIGSKQPGLPDCVINSLNVLPPLLQAAMLANIIVVGGNACIPGFVERLEDELRALVKSDWTVRVRKMEHPEKSTWLGAARLASRHRNVVKEYAVTKEDYLEYGSAWAARKFMNGDLVDH